LEKVAAQHVKYAVALEKGGTLPPDCLIVSKRHFVQVLGEIEEVLELVVAAGADLSAFRRGPRAKSKHRTERHHAITALKGQGFTDEEIFAHLKLERPELVRKGKNGWIKPEQMMRDYRDSQR
jgi:hypothetical protein